MKYVKYEIISLKNSNEYNEKWLQTIWEAKLPMQKL